MRFRHLLQIAACSWALLSITPLTAGPIESLPEREWTSSNGTKIQARLAFFADRRKNDGDDSLLLVPAQLTQPPLVVRRSALSIEDQRYIDLISSPYGFRSDFDDLRKEPLTYVDGEPVPGKFVYYDNRARVAHFLPKREKRTFMINLESLSPESLEKVTKSYAIPPVLETPLALRVPLEVNASAPPRFELKNVPLVKQDGSYCVPASAAMIANFHNLRITQAQLANLSSDASRQHKGTWSGDMANAMEMLGFLSETRLWADLDTDKDFARFERDVLPFIRASLQQDGPLYVSFKPGVYGTSGHGCVIVGYNDRGKGELSIHNPWGKRETYDYRDFSRKAQEVVRFRWQSPAAGDSAALEKSVMDALHRMPVDLTDAMNLLRAAGLKPALRLHGRRDRRDDRFEIERWSLAQGFRVIKSTLAHHPLCLIPVGRDDRIIGWYLLRNDADNPAPLVRPRGVKGWSEAARLPADTVFKTWSTSVNIPGELNWDMPLIELDV